MPNKTEEEQAARTAAIEAANQGATQVPLDVLENAVEALKLAAEVADGGLPASLSDAGVAGACALAAAEGAALNVRINLPSVTDAAAADRFGSRTKQLLDEARTLADNVRTVVEKSFDEN
jgi:glutamate formiminotransferase/formiminotetrahydrofolate cyclodeaminase